MSFRGHDTTTAALTDWAVLAAVESLPPTVVDFGPIGRVTSDNGDKRSADNREALNHRVLLLHKNVQQSTLPPLWSLD